MSTSSSTTTTTLVKIHEDEQLINWEIINSSDADSNDDVCSLNSWSSDLPTIDLDSNPNTLIDNLNVNETPLVVFDYNTIIDDDDDDRCEQDDEVKKYIVSDDDDDCEDDDGLDDELVPRYVSGKVGRERMRKLGKRGFAKMNNSKRLPYSYVKAGCVFGKHGLGMKHSF